MLLLGKEQRAPSCTRLRTVGSSLHRHVLLELGTCRMQADVMFVLQSQLLNRLRRLTPPVLTQRKPTPRIPGLSHTLLCFIHLSPSACQGCIVFLSDLLCRCTRFILQIPDCTAVSGVLQAHPTWFHHHPVTVNQV